MKLTIKQKNIREADTKLLGTKELSDAVTDLGVKIQRIVVDLELQKVPLQVAAEFVEDKSSAQKLEQLAENGTVTFRDIFMSSDVLSNIDKQYLQSINYGDENESY